MDLNRLFQINDSEQRYIDGGTGVGLLITNTILSGVFVWAVFAYMSISGNLSGGLINKSTMLPIISVIIIILWGIANAIIKKWVPFESAMFISAVCFIVCGYNGRAFAKGICIIKDGADIFAGQEELISRTISGFWIGLAFAAILYAAAGYLKAKTPYSPIGFLWFFKIVSPLLIVALVVFVFKASGGTAAAEAIDAPLTVYELLMGFLAGLYLYKFALHAVIGDIPPEGWYDEPSVQAESNDEAEAAPQEPQEQPEETHSEDDVIFGEDEAPEGPEETAITEDSVPLSADEAAEAAEEETIVPEEIVVPAEAAAAEADETAETAEADRITETEKPVEIAETIVFTDTEAMPLSDGPAVSEMSAEEAEEPFEIPAFPTFEFDNISETTFDFAEELKFDTVDAPEQNKIDDDIQALIDQIRKEESR